jgi:hypothetical protein
MDPAPAGGVSGWPEMSDAAHAIGGIHGLTARSARAALSLPASRAAVNRNLQVGAQHVRDAPETI